MTFWIIFKKGKLIKEHFEYSYQIYGVLATIILAIATTIAILLTKSYYDKQIELLERGTRLEWRPYLNINHREIFWEFGIGEEDYIKYKETEDLDNGEKIESEWSDATSINGKVNEKYNNCKKN